MISSNRFGGRGTTAGSRVQVGSAAQTESGAVIPAEQQASGSSQSQLFPHHISDVDVGGALEQGIKIGVVSRLRIRAEHRRVDVDIDLGADIGQTPPTFTLHGSVQAAPPEVFSIAGGLQLSSDRHRPYQIKIQSFERGIVGLKFPNRPHRASLKVPDVDSQHSRLK
jgi:hypothetical protein